MKQVLSAKPRQVRQPKKDDVTAARRQIATENHPIFLGVIQNLAPELHNVGRLFDVGSLGISVVGFSRFTKRHRLEGPATAEVSAAIPSTRKILKATLGEIGIFGSGNKHKLGFTLISPQLLDEIDAFEMKFAELGYPLGKEPNNDTGEPNPHCSVALLYNDHVDHFKDERTLSKLGSLCQDLTDGQVIHLQPMNEPVSVE